MTDTQNLGSILSKQRDRLGLTLLDVSKKSGVSVSYIGRIENAERYPSPEILRKISKPLEFDEKELFSLAGYLPLEGPVTSQLYKHNLLDELDILIKRVTADLDRIKKITKALNKRN